MNTYLKIIIIAFLLIININGQGMWHDYGLSNSSFNFGSNKSVDNLKSIIMNDNIDSPLGHYSYAAEYLFYEFRSSEVQFLIENLNTVIEPTLPFYENLSQWQKYYTDAYILGLLGEQNAILKMETIANSSSVFTLKRDAITRLAEAEIYNYYEFVKEHYLNNADEGNSSNGIYEFSLYGRDSRYTNDVRSILEPRARAQTNFMDITDYSYIGNFDNGLYINIMNDHFENSQGKERYDTFFHLGIEDFGGQPERTIFALQNEENDSLRAEYIPFPSSIIERGMYSMRYLQPLFINSLSLLTDFSTTSSTYAMKQYFLTEFEPVISDTTETVETLLDTLISYTNQCYEYEWITNQEIYSSLSKKLENAKKDLETGNEQAAKNNIESFQNEVDAQNGIHITNEGYKFLYYYPEYIIEQLPAGETLTIESLSPSMTITKTKDFTLTVYGNSFTKKSDVHWNGKKKKTKFISENVLEAEIKDKGIKKEGTYTVHVSEKKVGRTEELEFRIYKELPEKLIPTLNCIEELEKNKYRAWFGYENYNDGIVLLNDKKENEIKGEDKKSDKPPVIFLPGIHEKFFSVEYDKKDKLKWELGKEKAEVTEDSPLCQ